MRHAIPVVTALLLLVASVWGKLAVTTLAGGGTACNKAGYKDGLASEALFNLPARVQAVALPTNNSASRERLFVLDNHNGCIRSFPLGLSPADTFVRSDTGCGTNSTLAYLGPDAKYPNGTSRKWRWVDGPLDFWVAADARTVWVMDTYNNQLKAATKSDVDASHYGPWTIIAGSGAIGSDDGDAGSASFYQPHGMAVAETTGFAYVSDTFSSCIRSVSLSTGKVATIAGTCGQGGHRDAPPGASALSARFNHVHKVTVDPRNESILYVSDVECSDDGPLYIKDPCKASFGGVVFTGVRKLEMRLDGTCASVTTIAGYFDPTNPKENPTGFADGPVSMAKFHYVHAVAVQPLTKPLPLLGHTEASAPAMTTELYICDDNNYRIRKVDLAAGTVTTLAGNGKEGCADSGDATTATLGAVGLGLGADGTVYIADYLNHRIRALSLVVPTPPTPTPTPPPVGTIDEH
jgi:hypothetical protein